MTDEEILQVRNDTVSWLKTIMCEHCLAALAEKEKRQYDETN